VAAGWNTKRKDKTRKEDASSCRKTSIALALDRDQLICLSHEAISSQPAQAAPPQPNYVRLHLAMIDDELITELFII